MQAQILSVLALPAGSLILEAGCGFARVALFMAKYGMRVIAIDNLDYHISGARQNVEKAGLPKGQVVVKKMDYHHLEAIPTESLDGVYTMQALGHAADLESALAGFHRVVRPGGRIAFMEAERRRSNEGEKTGDMLSKNLKLVNGLVGYPTNEASREDYFKEMVEKAGFVEVKVRDFSENIWPMLRLCYLMMIVPFFFVRLLGLEKYFVTMVAVTYSYLGRARWRFIAISATKSVGKPG
jgi:sterol 24-C-methyltransferase